MSTPAISSIAPTSGTTSGGQVVSIVGTQLSDVSNILFGTI